MATISDEVRSIIEKKTFAHVATLMPDGSPQSTPVWIDVESDQLLFNTAEGRQKPENLRRDPRVAISFTDPDDPYQMVMVQGEVAEITESGADEHIDRLARKYLGEDTYPFRKEGEVRLIVRVDPTNVATGL